MYCFEPYFSGSFLFTVFINMAGNLEGSFLGPGSFDSAAARKGLVRLEITVSQSLRPT